MQTKICVTFIYFLCIVAFSNEPTRYIIYTRINNVCAGCVHIVARKLNLPKIKEKTFKPRACAKKPPVGEHALKVYIWTMGVVYANMYTNKLENFSFWWLYMYINNLCYAALHTKYVIIIACTCTCTYTFISLGHQVKQLSRETKINKQNDELKKKWTFTQSEQIQLRRLSSKWNCGYIYRARKKER